MLKRVLDWWRREPPLPSDDDFVAPVMDEGLASEMSTAASLIAANDSRLDYSRASAAVVAGIIVSGRCSGVELHRYGAYVGEVLRRNSTGFAWAVSPRRPRTPGLAVGKEIADPFELVERYSHSRPHPADTLVAAVDDLLTYAADPTDETSAQLGWTRKLIAPTAWESMKDNWHRKRRAWRRRRSRREDRNAADRGGAHGSV